MERNKNMSQKEIKWPQHPTIYEINTWPWLKELSESQGSEVDLLDIPEAIVDLDLSQFEVIWLMGVWERSPESRKIAQEHPDLQKGYRTALKNYKKEDIVGSPYAVYYYQVDYRLGGEEGLALIREHLREQGVLLILDYVPNHTAIDHLWTKENSEIYLQATEEDLEKNPDDVFKANDTIIWHGKDPYFYPWTDTAQINPFSNEARKKTIDTLLDIGTKCDGVRCDMAMLLTNEVFTKTWNGKLDLPPAPEKDFWEEVIPAVKEQNPDFKFLGEVYWDMEWKLMQQGFDYCYDKTLYDRLKNETAKTIRAHLQADWSYQKHLIRFIENHDEMRAIKAFGKERSKAGAILILTLPGARLIHDGQMKGCRIKLPVQLGKRAYEEEDQELLEFYLRLINASPGKEFENGNWSLCKIDPIGGFSNTNLIAHIWTKEEHRRLTVVNYSPYPAKGHIKIPNIDYGENDWSFGDLLNYETFVYQGENLQNHGLYVELGAWKGHIFEIKKNK